MTEKQIEQKAEAEADKVIIGSRMDRVSVIHLKHLLVTMYMQGATEATKELQNGNFVLTVNEIIEGKDKKIADLEKENAELKARLNAINLLTPELEKKSKLRRQQLTNAKEIIKELLTCARNYPESNKQKMQKAEQFLSEVEK